MAPKRGQAPFLQELSSLEVEPLDIVDNALEQDRSLETLITPQGKVGVVLLLPDTLPANHHHHCHHCGNCSCNCTGSQCGCTGSHCECSGCCS
jgi:hypothetical protein